MGMASRNVVVNASGILRGGFGLSYRTRQPVPDEIAGRIPAGEGAGFRYENRWLVRDNYGQGR